MQELAYGVCRWYFNLRPIVDSLLRSPLKARDIDVDCLLLVGVYQLGFLDTAPHAALAETVQATRLLGKGWASGLVNGVLRQFQRRSRELLAMSEQRLQTGESPAGWLLDRVRCAWPLQWKSIYGESRSRPPLVLRINARRSSREHYLTMIAAGGVNAAPVPFCPDALVLDRPMAADQIPGFKAGIVSVQDAAAQLAARLLDMAPGDRVLDACAAPGGKTCHILELQPNLGRMVALDSDPRRLQRVEDNLHRLGLSAEVCCGDASAPAGLWAEGGYDRILLDAPCSASGVIRRHPDINLLRSGQDLTRLQELQKHMLDALWSLLVPGGVLLYVTCSVLPEENDAQLSAFLKRHADAAIYPILAQWGRPLAVGRQILPGEHGMDGFFYGRLRKTGTGDPGGGP